MKAPSLFPHYVALIIVFAISGPVAASTDPLDALRDLYWALSKPPQLKGWNSSNGDCCGESWTGVYCSGSSVTNLNLHGLNISGYLGNQFSNLHSLKNLDLSSNHIQGEISGSLPPNVTSINLSSNNFTNEIPYSLASMINLRHLNLSHNSFSGPIGNIFTGVHHLKEMDLSYNSLTGDLPSSFGTLTNLTRLYLQNNNFTGSVLYLANLSLTDLNIQHNDFSGVIPKQFQFIQNLWIGGNRFQPGGNYSPWDFPSQIMPNNISSPPTTESSAMENYPIINQTVLKSRKQLGLGGMAFMVGGVTLLLCCIGLILTIRIKGSKSRKLHDLNNTNSPVHYFQNSTVGGCSPEVELRTRKLSVSSPHMLGSRHTAPAHQIRRDKMNKRRSFSKACIVSTNPKPYTMEELQSATKGFSDENFLGDGSLGSVYKAVFSNGQVFAVKNISTAALSLHEEEQFMDVIKRAAHLRHQNIVTLVGYCMEDGQHFVVYEYVRNFSLDDALHYEENKPLSWGVRLQIAIGIARALDYLHSSFSPPMAHSNLKAANILLDEELMPRICDCGLAVLRPLTSNSVKLKAAELAISSTGYIAPEHGNTGGDKTKGDIYAYGVLLLELLTGRRPLDSFWAPEERCLVKWASSQLHDCKSLEQMMDSNIRDEVSHRSLSHLADIISLCIQPEKEFRPPMSEIVESLTSLVRCSVLEGSEMDTAHKSFRSTNTCFNGSPTMTYQSFST